MQWVYRKMENDQVNVENVHAKPVYSICIWFRFSGSHWRRIVYCRHIRTDTLLLAAVLGKSMKFFFSFPQLLPAFGKWTSVLSLWYLIVKYVPRHKRRIEQQGWLKYFRRRCNSFTAFNHLILTFYNIHVIVWLYLSMKVTYNPCLFMHVTSISLKMIS